ncbi:MAG: peptidyl-prolyl cis-trans isomerase [Spirochaetia bacterium]|nr:peptidyl-prolyl cis-trans isomerase [Spirochaetia bacterium]
MKKPLIVLLMAATLASLAIAQTLGTPMATVKLTKTEIISVKAFTDTVAKYEAVKKATLTEDERKALLDEMINDVLFYQMCERDGIKASDAEVNAYITQVKSQLGPNVTDAQFEAYLAGQGVMMADLRVYYKKQILLQRWLAAFRTAEIAAIPKVTSKDILDTYELYKSKLVRPDTVRIAMIYYPYTDRTEAERTKAVQVIKDISERIAKGESFDALRLKAADGSYGATRDYIYVQKTDAARTQYGPIFDNAFAIKDGAVSAPFENDAGWWIVRRAEFFPQKQLELSDPIQLGQQGTVQDYLTQQLALKRQNEFMYKTLTDLFKELRGKAEIKIIGKP